MAITDKNYSEKRNFIRMRVNTEIALDTSDGQVIGLCKDISGSGLLIELDREIAIGTVLTAHINQNSERHSPFRATCEAARILHGENGKFLIGLIVKDIHD
jgi:hypothetical protein